MSAHVWDATSGALLSVTTGRSASPPAEVAVSPDGQARATIAPDGIVTVRDSDSGEVLAELPGRANAVSWSSDGRLAVAVRNGTIVIWKRE